MVNSKELGKLLEKQRIKAFEKNKTKDKTKITLKDYVLKGGLLYMAGKNASPRCPVCGKKVKTEDYYCGECGHKLKELII